MASKEAKEKGYLHKLVRGETYLDPIRLVGALAEIVGKKILTGTIFRRK